MEREVGPYSLVIAEKPDAAQHIAFALDNNNKEIKSHSWKYWIAYRNGIKYVICPASGHIFDIKSKKGTSNVYPVFDIFWNESKLKRQTTLFRLLSKNARKFIIACDYDLEGDTIGYNIIKYACSTDPNKVLRAKFSTLTEEDLLSAFDSLTQPRFWSLAAAGRARHFVDFVWGINFSRALSLSGPSGNYLKLSLGRVQGPTLNYVYQREKERNLHVPLPYWKVFAVGNINEYLLRLEYANLVQKKAEADQIKHATEYSNGIIDNVIKRRFAKSPPSPFNLSDLQHEAYEVLHMNPSRTLKVAESLYLGALISYPRTNSQKLPTSLDLDKILRRLSENQYYYLYVKDLIGKKPVQGKLGDSAHPAIFPTGLHPVNLDREHYMLYDLIVRRFLASFSRPCIKETMHLQVINNTYLFTADFERIIYSGFMSIYNPRKKVKEWIPFEPRVGSLVKFSSTSVVEGYTQPPFVYNPASLLARMEEDEIGTKATRSDIVDVLYKRGYITGKAIQITKLGMTVIEMAKRSCPELISVETTRELERDLIEVEENPNHYNVVLEKCASNVLEALVLFEKNKDVLTETIPNYYNDIQASKNVVGKCPVCKTGSLLIIKSRKSGKRFVGCTNYSKGCNASAPLPQRGSIRYAGNSCKKCGWPIILVFFPRKRYPWRICINMKCPRKLEKEKVY